MTGILNIANSEEVHNNALAAARAVMPMSKFEGMLRLWMAGFGVSQAEADKICANPQIAADIKAGDAGGIVQDLAGVVEYGSEVHRAADSTAGKLELMFVLNAVQQK